MQHFASNAIGAELVIVLRIYCRNVCRANVFKTKETVGINLH